MSDDALEQEETAPETISGVRTNARTTLAKRLADVVCLPTSRVTPQERHITGDLLLEMLRGADPDLRRRIAKRISGLSDAPSALVRYLGRDTIDVSQPLLVECDSLRDSDLVAISTSGSAEHRRLIASRREVSELVGNSLVEYAEPDVIEALLKNSGAELSTETVECMVAASREHLQFCRMLVRRPELRPSQALTLYWWSDTDSRRAILRRFAVDRSVLQEVASDVFVMAAAESWADDVVRKALQFIERRQRNRAALDKCAYDSVEALVDTAARIGLDAELAEELSYLCGVKPACGAKILSDPGGEPIAVLCKSVGLKREGMAKLWRALRRPNEEGDENWANALETYDSLSNEKSQTVLRYWNWSLTSAFSPTLADAYETEADDIDAYSAAQKSARLVFGRTI